MVRITEELVRKRAEHNEQEIFSLEELSLHQEAIERIECLDKWCREIKILYFQDNIIPKIENVNKMKKLEYLNLAVNNIMKIENLEGCESLRKLDLTVNFVHDLLSVESLKGNYNIRELFLTGNPCAFYEGYREFVIATLPQLEMLDGHAISRSERILAMQELENNRRLIKRQQEEYEKKDLHRYSQKNEESDEEKQENSDEEDDPEEERRFWEQKSDYTPETRIKIAKRIHRNQMKKEGKSKKPKKERKRVLFNESGKPYNINEAKLEFKLIEDEEANQWILDLAIYKFMDTSLVDVDIQPTYVRVKVRNKLFQLCLVDEVKTDSSTVRRSQTTGHLVINMPKVKEPPPKVKHAYDQVSENLQKEVMMQPKPEKLDVKEDTRPMAVLDKIVTDKHQESHYESKNSGKPKENYIYDEKSFDDNPEVPPLIAA